MAIRDWAQDVRGYRGYEGVPSWTQTALPVPNMDGNYRQDSEQMLGDLGGGGLDLSPGAISNRPFWESSGNAGLSGNSGPGSIAGLGRGAQNAAIGGLIGAIGPLGNLANLAMSMYGGIVGQDKTSQLADFLGFLGLTDIAQSVQDFSMTDVDRATLDKGMTDLDSATRADVANMDRALAAMSNLGPESDPSTDGIEGVGQDPAPGPTGTDSGAAGGANASGGHGDSSGEAAGGDASGGMAGTGDGY